MSSVPEIYFIIPSLHFVIEEREIFFRRPEKNRDDNLLFWAWEWGSSEVESKTKQKKKKDPRSKTSNSNNNTDLLTPPLLVVATWLHAQMARFLTGCLCRIRRWCLSCILPVKENNATFCKSRRLCWSLPLFSSKKKAAWQTANVSGSRLFGF